MTEIRCVKCGRRLFDIEFIQGRINIKCPKCGTKNDVSTDKNMTLYVNSKIIGFYEEHGTGYLFKCVE